MVSPASGYSPSPPPVKLCNTVSVCPWAMLERTARENMKQKKRAIRRVVWRMASSLFSANRTWAAVRKREHYITDGSESQKDSRSPGRKESHLFRTTLDHCRKSQLRLGELFHKDCRCGQMPRRTRGRSHPYSPQESCT